MFNELPGFKTKDFQKRFERECKKINVTEAYLYDRYIDLLHTEEQHMRNRRLSASKGGKISQERHPVDMKKVVAMQTGVVKPTWRQKKLARIYIRELYRRMNGEKPITKKAMLREADYIVPDGQQGGPATVKLMGQEGFKAELARLLPQEKILIRLSKGIDNQNDDKAFQYVKLATEVHKMIGQKEPAKNLTINTESVNIASLLGQTQDK